MVAELFDPTTLQQIKQAADAAKAAFDTFKAALGLVREAKDALPSSEQKEAISRALDEAEKSAQVAQAQLAAALGYELCRAHFPPVVMLDVGFISRGPKEGTRVFECPMCGNKSPGTFSYTRTAPPR